MAKRRLLLADDSVTIQKVVNLTFAEEGIEVVTAGDGNAAMERFVESAPDLVMVDVNMPGLDGYRICEMIKQDDETKHIPVVLLVGSFEPFDEAEARRVGADDYLTKPFQSIRQLVSRVSDLLNRSNQNNSSDNQNNSASESQPTQAPVNNYGNASEITNTTNFESFNDTGIDDEMIQTSQIVSLPTDETQKFISEQYFQTTENNFTDWNADEEDTAKTESSNAEDFEPAGMHSTETEIPQFDEKIFDFADEQPLEPESAPKFSEQETLEDKEFSGNSVMNDNRDTAGDTNFNMATQPLNDSFFDFDDLNLLEIPTIVQQQPTDAAEQKTAAEETPQNPPEGIVEEKQTASEKAQFSPEVIEAIAKRVVEKLSDKLVKEITRDIVPQTTELILEEMARNKTN